MPPSAGERPRGGQLVTACAAAACGVLATLALCAATAQPPSPPAGRLCFTFSQQQYGARERLAAVAAEVDALSAAGVPGLGPAAEALRSAAAAGGGQAARATAALDAAPAPPALPAPRPAAPLAPPRPAIRPEDLWSVQDKQLREALRQASAPDAVTAAGGVDPFDAVRACPGSVWQQLRELADASQRADTDPQLDWGACEVGSWGAACGAQQRPQCLRVARTRTSPPLYMPYTNPKHDVDVSAQLAHGRVVESGMTHIWSHILRGCCAPDADGSRGVVLDVGANFGWYSVLAAASGCSAVAWEPVPKFRSFLSAALQLNSVAGSVEVRRTAAGNASSGTVPIVVPQRGIWGTAGVGGLNIDRAVDNRGDYDVQLVPREKLDDVRAGQQGKRVCVLKVDVEGYEPEVFAGSEGSLASGAVHNVFLEYSPGVYERAHRWRDMHLFPEMLMNLIKNNFELVNINDGMTRLPVGDTDADWRGPVKFHPERVTADSLRADLRDCEDFRQGVRNIPEGLRPESLHSAFGHNTNIWAARVDRGGFAAGGVTPGRVVGVGPDSPYGLGGRPKARALKTAPRATKAPRRSRRKSQPSEAP